MSAFQFKDITKGRALQRLYPSGYNCFPNGCKWLPSGKYVLARGGKCVKKRRAVKDDAISEGRRYRSAYTASCSAYTASRFAFTVGK